MAVFLDTREFETEVEWDDFNRDLETICENLDSYNEHLFVRGSVGRWNGTSTGMEPVTNGAMNEFYRMFKDCDDFCVNKEQDGLLTITGWHHDGTVEISWYTVDDNNKKFKEQFDFDYEGDIAKIDENGELSWDFDHTELYEFFIPAEW